MADTTETATQADSIEAIRIDVNGTITRVRLGREASTIQSLYRETGARWVERFVSRAGDKATQVDAWMDEEGRFNGSQPNAYASAVIAHLLGELPVVTNATLWDLVTHEPGFLHYGNIVLTGFDADAGDTTNVPADLAGIITAIGLTVEESQAV